MKIHRFVKNCRGDTIVEVLIAISVVSLLLAGAYTSTRRSASATRTAQEQGEALKIAESQVELIKVAINSKTLDLTRGDFCIDSNSGSIGNAPCSSGTIPYSVLTTHVPTSSDFIVKVTWPGLAGGTNSTELDYGAQP